MSLKEFGLALEGGLDYSSVRHCGQPIEADMSKDARTLSSAISSSELRKKCQMQIQRCNPKCTRCPKCSREMHRFAHRRGGCHRAHRCAILGFGKRGCACIPAPTRRAKRLSIRCSTTPFLYFDTESVMAFSATEMPRSVRVRLSHPFVQLPQPSGGTQQSVCRISSHDWPEFKTSFDKPPLGRHRPERGLAF